jgi:hypothetical protein
MIEEEAAQAVQDLIVAVEASVQPPNAVVRPEGNR